MSENLNQNISIQLEKVFKSFFKNEALTISKTTTTEDIESWDSLNHMGLIAEIEKKFEIIFDFYEVMEFENVGELIKSIVNKKAN
ncbi:MAG: acyl carrier protein [Flavobacteriales bacterium]|nr:acyl carrier protein [Flavobacteriales bacterium]|tara:strand:- start:189 stop:443 length:255 start_codon:yes stop_codon:yes gene_type:complete